MRGTKTEGSVIAKLGFWLHFDDIVCCTLILSGVSDLRNFRKLRNKINTDRKQLYFPHLLVRRKATTVTFNTIKDVLISKILTIFPGSISPMDRGFNRENDKQNIGIFFVTSVYLIFV